MKFAIEKGDMERKLDDVKRATFDLFLQWTYRGDYVVPHRKAIAPPSKPVPRSNLDATQTIGHGSKGSEARSLLNGTTAALPPPSTLSPRILDFTHKVLKHAKLYVFAERLDVPALEDCVITKLGDMFKDRPKGTAGAIRIIDVLRFVYGNTSRDHPCGFEEMLRTVVVRDLSSDIIAVIERREFQNLMLRNKEMLADVLANLKENMGNIPTSLETQAPLKRTLPSDQVLSEEAQSEKRAKS